MSSERAGIAFVVPHRYREPIEDVVKWCLKPLAAELGERDHLVVSDQGSPSRAYAELSERMTFEGSWCLLPDENPPAVWNISRARNRGLELAERHCQPKYVWPIDIDIRVPEGAVELARAAMDAGADGLAPLVRDHDPQGRLLRLRPGSGIAILRVEEVLAVGGWDEKTFEGYGSEDIDLFRRIEAHRGAWRCELWRDGPHFLHKPHPPQPRKLEYQRWNIRKLENRHSE